MLNPDEDTEWNDILRAKGILPPKKVEPDYPDPPSPVDPAEQLDKLNERQLEKMIELTIDNKEEDETSFLEEYRKKRIAMMREEQAKARFGSVREVSKADWTKEVNEAAVGDIYVVVHISQKGHRLCSIIDQHLVKLAPKFPMVKFLRGESTLCIPNYPECNLPTLIVYHAGELLHNLVGPRAVGGDHVSLEDLERQLGMLGVVKTKLTSKKSAASKQQEPRFEISLKNGGRSYRLGSSESDDSCSDD